MISHAVEDYLKAIYELQQSEGSGQVSTSALAGKLGFAPASVTGMLKKLSAARPRLVDYERHRGASLTPAGERIALQVIRHHRLIESYLSEALGYTWDEVHNEADRLEHVISEEFEDRIAAMLGHPQTDPHGDPIPDRDGGMVRRPETRLTDLEAGQSAEICRVSDHDPALLRYLSGLGISLRTRVQVTGRGPFGGPLHVRVAGAEAAHPLNPGVTDHVFVTPETASPSPEDGE
ncbi:MAG: metal-dependent transcriptional regulator [Chloroflexi bacterium]|nr:metal-dependent transcriptional regulator [Chloroflexota bacterium]